MYNPIPSFGKIQPSEATRVQDISFDESGVSFDEALYTFDGISGSSGNQPSGVIINTQPYASTR